MELVKSGEIRFMSHYDFSPFCPEVTPQMTSWITICDTCKRPGWDPAAAEMTDGERFAILVEAEAVATVRVRTRRVSCTMGCERACNVVVQGRGKFGYSLGMFEPGTEAAAAIVAWAALHAESETGQVPYRQWPQGVKGHFVSRQAPLPLDDPS
jgi:predicted metal-binding protein